MADQYLTATLRLRADKQGFEGDIRIVKTDLQELGLATGKASAATDRLSAAPPSGPSRRCGLTRSTG